MNTLIYLILLPLALSAPVPAFALSLEDAAGAAKAANFEDKTFPKTGESYLTSKTLSKKKYSTFKTFPKSKTSSLVEQITLACNQCESKKISEANSIACFEDVQAIALKLKIDLPGGVIRSFEDVKSQQQSWDLKDKVGKSLRYTKTQVKCPKVSSEGIKFDFFFK
jgi:hypothetical protein